MDTDTDTDTVDTITSVTDDTVEAIGIIGQSKVSQPPKQAPLMTPPMIDPWS